MSSLSILKPHSAEVCDVARASRAVVADLHPDATEAPRRGEKCTTYGAGPRKMSEAYAHIMPLTDSVNLGFYRGSVLLDSSGLLSGTGKSSRHAKIRNLSEAASPSIRALVSAAIHERMGAKLSARANELKFEAA